MKLKSILVGLVLTLVFSLSFAAGGKLRPIPNYNWHLEIGYTGTGFQSSVPHGLSGSFSATHTSYTDESSAPVFTGDHTISVFDAQAVMQTPAYTYNGITTAYDRSIQIDNLCVSFEVYYWVADGHSLGYDPTLHLSVSVRYGLLTHFAFVGNPHWWNTYPNAYQDFDFLAFYCNFLNGNMSNENHSSPFTDDQEHWEDATLLDIDVVVSKNSWSGNWYYGQFSVPVDQLYVWAKQNNYIGTIGMPLTQPSMLAATNRAIVDIYNVTASF